MRDVLKLELDRVPTDSGVAVGYIGALHRVPGEKDTLASETRNVRERRTEPAESALRRRRAVRIDARPLELKYASTQVLTTRGQSPVFAVLVLLRRSANAAVVAGSGLAKTSARRASAQRM